MATDWRRRRRRKRRRMKEEEAEEGDETEEAEEFAMCGNQLLSSFYSYLIYKAYQMAQLS
jgi:hypothetical protein